MAEALEPIMPGRVRRWLKVHATADPELRALVERQVRATAGRVFGDTRRRMLLSLPPESLIKGAYGIGTVLYDRERWPAGLQAGEILQGIGIWGRSGSGKTNCVFNLLLQLAERGVPFLFLDWKRTGRHLLPLLAKGVSVYTPGRSLSPFPFNPFIPPPGFEAASYAGLVADQLAAAYTLGEGAVSLIQHSIAACLARSAESCSLSDVIKEVEQASGHARVRAWQVSALRALRSLEFSRSTGSLDGDAEPDQLRLVQMLLQRSAIVELDALPQGAKRFLIPMLCLWVYHARLGAPEREKLKLVIVVEEAHQILYPHPRGTHETVMEMLLRQCRELGIGIVVVDQHPHLISSAALGNTYATICFNLKDPSDVSRAAAMTLTEDKHIFGTLPVGHAVVKLQDRWRKPFLVRFPKLDVQKGAVTDSRLAGWMAEGRAGSAGSGALLAELRQVRQVPRPDRPLSSAELSFIEDVLHHQDDGVKARYRRLGLSGHRGNATKERLVREGWLESAVVPLGRTRKVILRPSKETKELLGLPAAATRREGIAHEYWKRIMAQRLEDAGYAVRIEAPRTGGASGSADVVGTKDGASVAVEIETGRSDAVANVRNDLRAGYARVVVACTDKAALAAVEASLARAGLLVPPRVAVVAAWEPWPLAATSDVP
ncbi:MAG: DUF87 domain-containing protein [Phycisphaerales bacterium]